VKNPNEFGPAFPPEEVGRYPVGEVLWFYFKGRGSDEAETFWKHDVETRPDKADARLELLEEAAANPPDDLAFVLRFFADKPVDDWTDDERRGWLTDVTSRFAEIHDTFRPPPPPQPLDHFVALIERHWTHDGSDADGIASWTRFAESKPDEAEELVYATEELLAFTPPDLDARLGAVLGRTFDSHDAAWEWLRDIWVQLLSAVPTS